MVARRGLERRSSSLRVEERRCCTLLAAMGAYPSGVLIADSRGDLNGITSQGGGSGCFGSGYGVVFKLATPRVSSGAWTKTVLHAFGRQPRDGLVPWAGLIIDAKGNLYGTTWVGGGNGTVFKLAPSLGGGQWTETVLYNFKRNQSGDGSAPVAGLIAESNGNLYGTTYEGGTAGNGTVFKLSGTGFAVSPR